MADVLQPILDAVAQVKADDDQLKNQVAALATSTAAEIAAVIAKLTALGSQTIVDPSEVASIATDLQAVHADLTTATASIGKSQADLDAETTAAQ